MTNKTFQVLGSLALGAWTITGAIFWMETKDHITLTVQETSESTSDEAALLAERMNLISTDMDALAKALENNLTLVATAIAEEGDARAVRSAVIEERLGRLEQALPHALRAREAAGALDSALTQVQALNSALLRAAESGAPKVQEVHGQPVEPKLERLERTETPSVPEFSDPGPVAVEQPALELPPQPASAPAKRSFLSFNLPSRDFNFVGLQSFEILGELSRVGFDAKSTLHDFTGVSNRVTGHFNVDLAHPNEGLVGQVSIQSKSLATGLQGRDEAMWEHLGEQDHPAIQYTLEGFESSAIDLEAKTLEGTARGQMSINGVTKPFTMTLRAHVDESRRLVIEGEGPLSRADYNVHIPDKALGAISTEDEVRLWIHLRSRAKAGEGQ